MQLSYTEPALSLAELGIKPGFAVELSHNGPVTILAEGSPVAYLLSAEQYELLRDAVGKAALAELMLAGHGNTVAGGSEPRLLEALRVSASAAQMA